MNMDDTVARWLVIAAVVLALYLLTKITNSLSRIETVVDAWADVHDLIDDLKLKREIERDAHVASLMEKQGSDSHLLTATPRRYRPFTVGRFLPRRPRVRLNHW